MKRSIKYGVNLKKKFFIWRDPVQFHYVDLPCYMYYGFESALGISIEMMIVMYKYKQFIKENAPAFDMRSKYHDAQLTKEQLENVEMEAIREMELEELQDMVEIPNYYEMFAQARRELNSDYIGVDFIFNNNKWVVNEIEDPVGAWMIYDLTNIDLAKIIVDYILKELNI